jgi:hypothetical protein
MGVNDVFDGGEEEKRGQTSMAVLGCFGFVV